MKPIVINLEGNEFLESRGSIQYLNTPNGCIVTTIVRYSTSISSSSVFVSDYNYIEDAAGFLKIENWEDTFKEEGQKVYDDVRKTVKGIFK